MASARRRILVADDDEDIVLLLRTLLEAAGYEVETCRDGRAALRAFHARPADLVLLDVTMPELDGFATLERLRDMSDVPVIVLTARGSEGDTVRGLRTGADDYVVKPFGREELLARIEAQLRRVPRVEVLESFDDGVLAVDFAAHGVVHAGRQVELTPLEFRLLTAFVQHPGQVLSAGQLLELAWGSATAAAADQVKLYVSYLRRKLGPAPDGSTPIETVRGFGYRYPSRRR